MPPVLSRVTTVAGASERSCRRQHRWGRPPRLSGGDRGRFSPAPLPRPLSYPVAVAFVVGSRGLLGDSDAVVVPRLRVQNRAVACVSPSSLRGRIGGGLLPGNRCRLVEGRRQGSSCVVAIPLTAAPSFRRGRGGLLWPLKRIQSSSSGIGAAKSWEMRHTEDRDNGMRNR